MTCNDCKFWQGGEIDPFPSFGVDDAAKGQCRRRAPLVTGGLHCPVTTEWPMTGIDDWCGDWVLASGIEARSDETRSGSAEGESPAPQEDAQ